MSGLRGSVCSARLLALLVRIIHELVLGHWISRNCLRTRSPRSQVNQLATLAAEGSIGKRRRPFDRSFASGAGGFGRHGESGVELRGWVFNRMSSAQVVKYEALGQVVPALDPKRDPTQIPLRQIPVGQSPSRLILSASSSATCRQQKPDVFCGLRRADIHIGPA